MFQLVENLLQINDKFHWFSFLLKHRKLSCALIPRINLRGSRCSIVGPSPETSWDDTDMFLDLTKGKNLVCFFISDCKFYLQNMAILPAN